MSSTLAENLSGKSIMSSDGAELGLLYNITVDLKTGELVDLLVEPSDEAIAEGSRFERDEEGRIQVPVARVRDVKDYIVVER